MGKIVMPKNSALLNEIESVLQIYYEAADWMSNDIYKTKLKAMIGDDQYSSSYTKKAQITSYFGFTVWEDIKNPQSRRKITESGKRMYEAVRDKNTNAIQSVIMNALETVKFGRDNYGCPESNSDVEPPALYIRAILDLGYLTYREFAFLLWKLEDIGANYTDSLSELKALRSSGSLTIGEEANKYADCKPIMILLRWGFLAEDTSDSAGGKHIVIDPSVKVKYERRLRNLKIYNIDMNIDEPINDSLPDKDEDIKNIIDESTRLTTGENILLYGVPGSGKSWTIEHEYCENEKLMERLVFHPDYMYSDFVGQILPKVVKGEDGTEKVRYEFTPGPFTKILKRAYQDPTNAYYLVIEEINRGNAPAIFGEIFQLLDRVDEDKTSEDNVLLRKCTSEYGITNANVAGVVYGDEDRKIRIPSNLSIVGTMNTSDQNVFTLDTAFQRRWIMRMIPNSFKNHKFAENTILDTRISWKQFCEAINEEILRKNNIMSSEDKRLGAYFVSADDLALMDVPTTASPIEQKQTERHNSRFAEKVLKYLWDDAFKFSHADTFDNKKYKSLEMIIDGFMSTTGPGRFRVFNKNLRSMIIDGVGEGDNIVSEDEE